MFLIRNFSSSSGSLSILQCILLQINKLGRDKSLAHHDKRELKMPWDAKSKQTRHNIYPLHPHISMHILRVCEYVCYRCCKMIYVNVLYTVFYTSLRCWQGEFVWRSRAS